MILPLWAFLGLYTVRVLETAFLRDVTFYASSEVILLFVVGVIVIPAFVMARIVPRISDSHIIIGSTMMILIFLFGLALNLESLIDLFRSRTRENMLEKITAINLASTASSYAIFLIIIGRKTFSSKLDYLRLLTAALLLAIVAISRSRGPILATATVLLLYFAMVPANHKKLLVKSVFFLVMAALVAAIYFDFDIVRLATERFFSTGKFSLRANLAEASGRIFLWSAAWDQFLDNPYFGDVIFVKIINHYPHNIIMEALISVGIFGSLFLFLYLYITLSNAVKLLRRRSSSLVDRFAALIFLKLLVETMFSGTIWGTNLWVASVCVVGLSINIRPAGLGGVQKTLQQPPGSAIGY